MEAATQTVAKLEASPNRPAEDEENLSLLSDRKELLTKQMEGDVKERNQLEYAIKAHRDSVQNMNFYRPTLEKAEKNWVAWKDLCDVLGSSDGNAFREIAQCYTFNFLVNFANEQLADLTSRYRLQAYPGTLQLEVIDRFMLDQVRAVNSLSGGETFIISLALALGLSSLSSNNLEIGSLFIDEGFGTLDRKSIDSVMDILVNLSGANKLVGVISHREELVENIPQQIHVAKTKAGSEITVDTGI
jgi:exonuclease SbcC